MLGKLAPGDVVTVTRIDRLARSTFDLFGIVKRIVDAKAEFRSLEEPWAGTGTSTGRLMLAVLGGLAGVERDLIRTRTAEGRSRAKAQGKHMGRPPRGQQTPRAGRYARRTRPQLQCQPRHDFSPYRMLEAFEQFCKEHEKTIAFVEAFSTLAAVIVSLMLAFAARRAANTRLKAWVDINELCIQ